MTSIIIPAYNSERYIERCLESLINQSYENWEAIVIDDGSTDSTSEIVDNYSLRDVRIRVFHKKNGGISAARNYGLDRVQGDNMMFLDSDDFLHPQALEIVNHFMKRDGGDIVVFAHDKRFRKRIKFRQSMKMNDMISPKQRNYDIVNIESRITDDIFVYASLLPGVAKAEKKWQINYFRIWKCLYRTKTFKTLRFPEVVIFEDFNWWSMVLMNIKKATIINVPIYYYFPSRTSQSEMTGQIQRIDSFREALRSSERYYLENATHEQYMRWTESFLFPLRKMLHSTLRNQNFR